MGWAPWWFTRWGLDRHFTWQEDRHFLTLTCLHCGEALVWSTAGGLSIRLLLQSLADHMADDAEHEVEVG